MTIVIYVLHFLLSTFRNDQRFCRFHRNRVEFEKPILTQTDGAAFTAELGTAEFLPTPTITIPEDLYEKYFTPYRMR